MVAPVEHEHAAAVVLGQAARLVELDASQAGPAEGAHAARRRGVLGDAVAALVADPQAAVGEARQARRAQQAAARVLGAADRAELARRRAREVEDAHAARELVDDQTRRPPSHSRSTGRPSGGRPSRPSGSRSCAKANTARCETSAA